MVDSLYGAFLLRTMINFNTWRDFVFSFLLKKISRVGYVLIFCEQYLFTCVAVLPPQHIMSP